MASILVDTGPLVALFDASEQVYTAVVYALVSGRIRVSSFWSGKHHRVVKGIRSPWNSRASSLLQGGFSALSTYNAIQTDPGERLRQIEQYSVANDYLYIINSQAAFSSYKS